MDYHISFLIFFASLIGMTAIILRKSIIIDDSHSQNDSPYPVLSEWYTPNLRYWKNTLARIWLWVHDISLRKWTYLCVRYAKYILYKLLRSLHKLLLSIIKILEREETNLKEKMRERGNLATPQHSEHRLMSALSRKRYPHLGRDSGQK